MSRPRASVPRMYMFPLGYPCLRWFDGSRYEWAQLGARGATYWPDVLNA